MRVLIVQYAGDYLAAHRESQRSGRETYYGHRYVLEQLAVLRAECEALEPGSEIAILCCLSGEVYDERLPSGVRVLGADTDPNADAASILRVVDEFRPTHVVVTGPMLAILRGVLRRRVRRLVLLADSFNRRGVRGFAKRWLVARILRDKRIEWIGNHGLNASRALAQVGVEAARAIPWDWPHVRRPDDRPARALDTDRPFTLLYVGVVIEAKGVGDVIEAIGMLRAEGLDVRLRVIGAGELDRFGAIARAHGVESSIDFVGLVTNDVVFEEMSSASIVVVPSRPEYPEGLPLTIYEALCARTPIVASDHPMFAGHLVDGDSALVYPAGEPVELAARVRRLREDAQLYARLSDRASETWARMQIDTKWGELVRRWVRNDDDDRAWLQARSLEHYL